MKVIFSTVFAILAAAVVAAAQPAARPNIVFLLADDLRPDCLGVLGHKIVKTPNLDKLLEHGFIFRNTYLVGANTGAVCTPSRTMIQTGQSYLRLTRAARLRSPRPSRPPATPRSAAASSAITPTNSTRISTYTLTAERTPPATPTTSLPSSRSTGARNPCSSISRRTSRTTPNMRRRASIGCIGPRTFPCR